jgi:4-amino-4-deoxy-L-arabinose transferase-like glycosyltransferase
MLSDRISPRLTTILRSPTLAVIAAYLVRIVLLCLTQRYELSDLRFQVIGLEEKMVAVSLAHGKGFFGPFPGYDALTAWLAPVYPLLLAAILKVSRTSPDSMVILGEALNCAFAAVTCWPLYSISKRLFGETTALATAWAWAFLPYAILMPLEWVWDQSLAALVLALIVDTTFRMRESNRGLQWSGYGLLWGLAALVNPALCGLMPFLLSWLVYQRRRAGVVSPALYARVAVMFVLSVLPWTIRNYYVASGWVFVKSNFGVELWVGNHPDSYRHYTHPIYGYSEKFLLIAQGEAPYSREKERLAMAYIRTHPGEFLKKTWDRVLDTWSAREDSLSDVWVKSLHLVRANVWICSIFSVLSFAGLVLALVKFGWESLPVALCLIIFPIPYYITHTALRYRHPIDPLMTIFAVYAVARLWRAISPHFATQSLETRTAT